MLPPVIFSPCDDVSTVPAVLQKENTLAILQVRHAAGGKFL